MWTPYDTINASLLLLEPPYDEDIVTSLLEDLRVYQDERQEIYQRAILAEHKLYLVEAEVERLREELTDCRSDLAATEDDLRQLRSEHIQALSDLARVFRPSMASD